MLEQDKNTGIVPILGAQIGMIDPYISYLNCVLGEKKGKLRMFYKV
jgi:hypothetical protein